MPELQKPSKIKGFGHAHLHGRRLPSRSLSVGRFACNFDTESKKGKFGVKLVILQFSYLRQGFGRQAVPLDNAPGVGTAAARAATEKSAKARVAIMVARLAVASLVLVSALTARRSVPRASPTGNWHENCKRGGQTVHWLEFDSSP